MSQITELGYATIGVSDIVQWETYCRDVMGMQVVAGEDDKTRYVRMDYQHHRIKLVENGLDDVTSIGLRVAGQEEFHAMAAKLEKANIKVRIGSKEEADKNFVLDIMFLEDPNGYAMEIYHGPLMQYNSPFHPGRGMHGGFKTSHGGFGHFMQSSKVSFDELYAFYSLLGFRGGVEYKMPIPLFEDPVEIMFLHCNDRQHSLAFVGTPAEKRANHFMFEVEELADVGLTHDMVKLASVPVVIEFGSHANDHNFSFYFKNPSSFMCEIGWGGRKPTGQSEYYETDTYGHAPEFENMKGFMIPA